MACACVWAAPLLLFNPLLMPLAAPRIGYLAIRLCAPAVALCVLGVWLAERSRELVQAPTGGRARAAAWLLGAALLVGPDVRAGFAAYGPQATAFEAARTPAPWRASLEFLDRAYPEPRVVLSDPVSSYGVAGLTRHDVVATLNQHSSPSDREAPERIQAALDAMSPGCPPARAAEVLRRYGVSLVFVNHTFPHRTLDFMASLDPGEYPAIEERFRSHPEVFREVFHAPGQWVYEVQGPAVAAYGALPAVEPVAREERPTRPALDLGQGTWLGGVAVRPAGIAPGESVWVDLLLRRDEAPPPAGPLVAEVSLATRVVGAPRGLPSRLRRLWAQRRADRVMRLSYWVPVRGPGGSPRWWPAGRWVRWSFALYVPGGAAAGTYAVRARVVRQEFRPWTDLREYFEDNENTPGGVLDSVVVGARATAAPTRAGGGVREPG